MEKLKLRVGDAEIIALQAVPGKIQPSTIPNRPDDVKFTLVDGRPAYLPMPVADRIYAARIKPGQQFEIRKISANNYEFKTVGAASAASTAPAAVAPQTASTTFTRNHTPVPAAPPVPPTPPPPPPVSAAPENSQAILSPGTKRLMGCFKMAIEAIAEAQDYARRKNVGITFNSEDVRAVAISCFIQCERNGGVR